MSTPQEYYADKSNYGNYQFVKIDDIIDGLMLEAIEDDDHYLRNTKRFLLYKYAKAGVKKLAFNVSGDVTPLAFTLNNNLQVILPQDYVDYVRISKLDSNGQYIPLNVNSSSDISKSYLHDSDNKIVFDSDQLPIEVMETMFRGDFHLYLLTGIFAEVISTRTFRSTVSMVSLWSTLVKA